MQKLNLYLSSIFVAILFCFLAIQPLNAQKPVEKVTIKGRVTDDKNNPLSNVSVKANGNNATVITKDDGSFSIDVSNSATKLIISYVGMETQELIIGGRTNITIPMKAENASLNDVVVVGYGTQKSRNVTGAMGKIGSREIKQVAVVGLNQAMQGRIAGVQVAENSADPGADVSIRIRGIASITSGTDPLVVVDGVPMAVNLNAINPNDIESIDVLKDASSAAIYGSRASAGVILVTTKRGKAGKMSVNVDAFFGQQSVGKKLDLLNGAQFAKLANENLVNGGEAPNVEWQSPATVTNSNWQDAIFNKAPMSNYNISLSGGTERAKNYLSLGYTNQDGILSTASRFERLTARFNSDYTVSDKFKLGVSINFSNDKRTGIRTQDDNTGVLIGIITAQPTNDIFTDKLGSYGSNLFGYNGYAIPRLQNNFYTGTNPLFSVNEHFFNRGRGTQLIANAYGEYEIIKGLKFKSMFGYTLSNSIGNNGNNSVPSAISVGTLSDRTGISTSFQNYGEYNIVNTLTYNNTFGKHSITGVIGTDALKFTGEGLNGSGAAAPPNQISVSATSPTTRFVNGNVFVPSSLFSLFGRVNYSYENKYLLSATVRRDGSSKFSSTNRYGNFPSASIGWRISQEKFMQNVKFVNELKVRASYGAVGNQNIANLQFLSFYGDINGEYGYTFGGVVYPGNRVTTVGNDAIRWETNVEQNIGVDATLFGGKLTLSVDYYKKRLKDLLGEVPIAAYAIPFGGNSIVKNAFTMENSGIELTLGFNQKIGDVNFSVNGNFSTLNNKVTGLDPSNAKSYVQQNLSNIGDAIGASSRTYVGDRLGNFWGYVFDGIFQTDAEATASGMSNVKAGDVRYRDINGDKKIDGDDRVNMGNGIPGYFYGINLRAEYKGFDINIFGNGQGDAQIANMLKYYTSSLNNRNGGLLNGGVEILNSWNGPGTSNTTPRNSVSAPLSNRWFSTNYIESAAFFRIRNIQIGYTLPAKALKTIGFNSLRMYVSAQNLLTFTKYSGFDPEVGSSRATGGSGTQTTGVDYGRYPMAKMVTVGFSAQF